jgi:beta-D-xylosidase 4
VCDTSSDPVARAKAVIALFTDEELIHNSVHESDGVPRLGLPPYNWWSEASHGVAWTVGFCSLLSQFLINTHVQGPGVSFAESGPFSYATSVSTYSRPFIRSSFPVPPTNYLGCYIR